MNNSLPTKEDILQAVIELEQHENTQDINYLKTLLYVVFLNETVLRCEDKDITERLYRLIDNCEKILYNNNEQKECKCDTPSDEQEVDIIEPWPAGRREIIPEFLSPITIFLYRRG